MSVMKDWHVELAQAIQDEYGVDSSFESARHSLLALIAKHCPLLPDVAYMPVPRCDSCKHWHGGAEGSNETHDRKTCVEPTADGEQMDEFMTTADFGCVRWEGK